MRIVLISTLFSPYARGGAERVAEMTARGLRDAGHDVAVITAGPKDGEPVMEEHDGIRVYRFRPPNLFFYGDIGGQPFWKRFIFHILDAHNSASARIVGEIIRKEKPDAVITENIKGIGFLIPRAIRGLGIRHIHVLHDIQLIEPSGSACINRRFHGLVHETVGKTVVRRVWAAWMKWLWGSPDVVVCPSKWIAEVYRAWGFFPKSRIETIPNPVEIHPSRHPEAKPKDLTVRSFADAQDDKRRLLFFGQVERHKGVFDLVEAARLMREDAVIDVVGDGSARKEMLRMTAGDPRFVFHGRVEPSRLPEFTTRAAATVCPSRCFENAPATIGESLAAGTPVIASRIGGISELVRDGENGWLITPGSIEELAAAMERALKHKNDPAMRDRCIASVRGRSVGEYVQKISALLVPGDPAVV